MSVGFSFENVAASLCRKSFYDFVREFWHTVIAEEPVWNWHIEYICEELQAVAERVFRGEAKKYDLIINVPPGTTKSTLVSVMFPAWTWTRMPSAKSICGSYAFPLAMDLSRKSRDVVTSTTTEEGEPKYQELFGIKLREDQNAKQYFMNHRGGARYAVGVGGAVLGMHGHFLIVDDPINPLEALSEADLQTANVWMSETLSQRKISKTISVLILVMQRLHQNDPTGELLDRLGQKRKDRVRHICLPCDDTWEIKPPELKTKYEEKGGLLDPIRIPQSVCEEARNDLGEAGYAGQYGQSPVPRGGAMFKVEKLRIVPTAPVCSTVVRYWDKAATEGGGCFTVGAKLGVSYRDKLPHFYVLDIVRGQWESHTREVTIQQTAKIDGKTVRIGIEEEGGSSGKDSVKATIARLAGFRCVADKPTGDKILRADEFSTQVNAGNVSVVNGPWLRDFIEELRYFPRSKYKDQVDAASGAFNMLSKKRTKIGAL